jgi:hypothetical protein
MKKIFSNNRIIAIAFLTVFSVALAPAAMAIEKKPAVPAELVFVGNFKNQPVFQLSVAGSAEQDEFTINITDEFGVSLYKENVKSENFTKKFLLNTDEIGDNTLIFEVVCKKTKQSVTYEVNRNSRFVQDLAITKIK